MKLVEPGIAAGWEGSLRRLTQKGVEELRHFGGREENDGLGEFRVGELVVGK